MDSNKRYRFHEFFAGSGLVSLGLSSSFKACWANDISERKHRIYTANLDGSIFRLGDIAEVRGSDLPDAQLSWASFPCQDLSLAGKIGGIHSERSGLVWQWMRIIDELGSRAPRVVCLENVSGLMSSNNGDDYRALHEQLSRRGYAVGAVLVNASLFVPQSRPRVFVIATRGPIPQGLTTSTATWLHPGIVAKVGETIEGFVWWNSERPDGRRLEIDRLIENVPFDKNGVISLIPESHLSKFDASGKSYAMGYRRTRSGKQVLEIRCDGIAGCLRTPGGGSSKQFLIHRGKEGLEARLLTVREVARLMGAPDSWKLPGSDNDGYFAMGDAVVAPVAEWLGNAFLYPLVEAAYEN